MNKCPYCGAEYADDVLECPIDHTPLVEPKVKTAPAASPRAESDQAEYKFAPTSAADRQRDLVTLVKCGTLVEADLVVSRLRAAGIQAFIPDECLMQNIGFNLNTFGYVRVQVAPQDYEAAGNLLSGTG
jgi:Putative prokaryotic signal transducing protein